MNLTWLSGLGGSMPNRRFDFGPIPLSGLRVYLVITERPDLRETGRGV
jgi:hypothetical protein